MRIIKTRKALMCENTYMAVSYVWSQYHAIEAIQTEISKVLNNRDYSSDTYIWLDKMSNKSNTGTNSKFGIRNMNKIYSGAGVTLALIPELEIYEVNFKQESDNIMSKWQYVEKLHTTHDIISFRKDVAKITRWDPINCILSSQWMKRTWTFQEQLLSKKIIVCLDGKILDISSIVKELLMINLSRNNFFKNTGREKLYLRDISTIMSEEDWNPTKILVRISAFMNECNWTLCYQHNEDFEYNRIQFNRVYNNALLSSIDFLEALVLVSDRLMGSENVGYEPIDSLYDKNISINKVIRPNLLLPIKMLAIGEDRSNINNLCWLPLRLNTDERYILHDIWFRLNRDNMVTLHTEVVYCLEEDISNAKKIYFEAGNTTDMRARVYIGLDVQDREEVDDVCIFITHYSDVKSYEYLTIPNWYMFYMNNEMKHYSIKIGRKKKDEEVWIKRSCNINTNEIIKCKTVTYDKLILWASSKGIIFKDMIY